MSVSWYVNGSTPSTGSWKRYLIDSAEFKMFEQDDCNHSIIYVKDDTPQTFIESSVLDAAATANFMAGVNYCAEDLFAYDLAYQVFQKGVCGQSLNLYDEDSNVVGYFRAGFYDSNDNFLPNAPLVQIYITGYSRSSGGIWYDGDVNGYPAESGDPNMDYFCFRYLTLGSTEATATKFKINIHRNDVQSYADIEFVYEPGEMPKWNFSFVNFYRSGVVPNFFNRDALKYTLLTFYKGNTDIIYAISTNAWNTQVPRPLNYVETNFGSYGHNSTGSVITYNKYRLDAEGLAFIEVIPQEDEYVNELNNRFSPRIRANMTGLYILPQAGYNSPEEQSGMLDLSKALVRTDLLDIAAGGIFKNDPAQYIVGIRWYYGLKPAIDQIKSTKIYDIAEGPITVTSDEAQGIVYLHAHYATTEFVEWHTSKLNVPAHFNNYLDFMSNYKLYLPYYGFIDIDPNDIVGGTIQVFYNINLFSGATTITISCKNSRNGNAETKYYSISCTVGHEIPFGAEMTKGFLQRSAETALMSAKFAMTYGGGAMAASAMQNINATNSTISNLNSQMTKDNKSEIKAQTSALRENVSKYQQQHNVAGALQREGELAGMISGVVQSPTRSNALNNETGDLDELHPYLLITRPVSVEPESYENYVGLPSSAAVTLNTCSGFTQIAAVAPESISLNVNTPRENEMNEIISLLQAGVYL